MRISDLSRQSGVPVATIKFYLREQLLPPGTPMGRNQASYGEAHLRRLLVIRALTSIAQLDLTSVRSLVRAIECVGVGGSSLGPIYQAIDDVLFPETQPLGCAADVHRARADVDRLLEAQGWRVSQDAPGRTRFAAVLVALRLLGCEEGIEFFDPYAEAAERLADHELNTFLTPGNDLNPGVTVIRTILLDAAQSAIRRMAQEHVRATRSGCAGGAGGELSNRVSRPWLSNEGYSGRVDADRAAEDDHLTEQPSMFWSTLRDVEEVRKPGGEPEVALRLHPAPQEEGHGVRVAGDHLEEVHRADGQR